jgi:hypothetical protein
MTSKAARYIAFVVLVLIAASGPGCGRLRLPRWTPKPVPRFTPPKDLGRFTPPKDVGRLTPLKDVGKDLGKIKDLGKVPDRKIRVVVVPPAEDWVGKARFGHAGKDLGKVADSKIRFVVMPPAGGWVGKAPFGHAGQASNSQLQAVRAHLSSLEGLSELREGLAVGATKNVHQEALEQLPEPVQRLWRGLVGLEELGADLAGSWEKAPDTATLARRLTDVQTATGDARLTMRLQGALIAKAEHEGHPAVARILRDLKLKDVSVQPLPPVPVPGLVPEPPAGTLPGQYEAVWQGLPELKQPATRASRQLYQSLTAQVNWHHEFRQTLSHSLTHLARHQHRLSGSWEEKNEKEQQARLASVQASLRRPLTPAERIIAADMVQWGKDAATVTAELEKPILRD